MRTMLQASVGAIAGVLLAVLPAPAVEPEAVNKAVERGVQALRKGQRADGHWDCTQNLGITALIALTLLESNVDAADPAVKSAAQFVRAEAVKEFNTYSLALAILFLDRLSEPVDEALIQAMTARLLAGQLKENGWSYTCPAHTAAEQEVLSKLVKEAAEAKEPAAKPGEAPPKEGKTLANEQLAVFQRRVQELTRGNANSNANADNSNTQFAILGLWIARRHGLPVEAALARVDQRFRAMQSRTGAWPYQASGETSVTMTAAGALCLAITDAASLNRGKTPPATARDLKKDPNLMAGLAALAAVIDDSVAKKKELGQPASIPQVSGKTYYFLWTLERVCVALDLEKLGNKDWYGWGAEILLANQQEDGVWKGEFEIADTCFALLFLRRANLARDLTVSLKGHVGDPAQAVLRGDDGVKNPVVKTPGAENGPKKLDEKSEQGKLAKEVVETRGPKQERLIEKYRDGKGVQYTEALASAIPHLTGEAKSQARDALAERLARMKPETLTNYLKDEEIEIRRCAALACALKESKAHIPNLIEMLAKEDPLVERAALAALRDLTGQNFGPAANATVSEREQAVTKWQEWWKKQAK